MRTLAMILAADVVLLALLFLVWADWFKPVAVIVVSIWSAGWIVAAYVFLIPGQQNIPMSLGSFAVAMLSLAGLAWTFRVRAPKYPNGMVVP